MPLGAVGWAALAGGAATLGGAAISSNASKSAASTESNAANSAATAQQQAQQPWITAGTQGLNTLQAGLAQGGQYTQPFTMADATNSSAEQYAQQQGSEAIQNSAAAAGGLIGTQAQESLTANAENVASQFQNQAYNQYMGEQQLTLGANESLAGLGQSSVTNAANNNASLTTSAANATAAGTVGSAGAVSSGLGSAGNTLSTLAGLFGTGGTTNSGSNATAGTTATLDPYNSLGGSATAGDYSDERLKEDIHQVGTTHDGLPIYTYRMKDGGPVKMGVMAQDVERRKPSAVTHDRQGYKMVDYSRVS